MPVNFHDPGGPAREDVTSSTIPSLAFTRGSDGSDSPSVLRNCTRTEEDPSDSLADIFLALWMTCGNVTNAHAHAPTSLHRLDCFGCDKLLIPGFRYDLPLTCRSGSNWSHSALTVRLAPRGFLTSDLNSGIVPVEELWQLSEGVRRHEIHASHFMIRVQQHVSDWSLRPTEYSEGLKIGPFHEVVASSFSRFMEADTQVGAPPIHPVSKGSSSLAVLGQALPEGLSKTAAPHRSARSRKTQGDGSSTKYCDVSPLFRQMRFSRSAWNITEEQMVRGFAALDWVLLLLRPDDSRTLEVPLRGSSFGLNTTERGYDMRDP